MPSSAYPITFITREDGDMVRSIERVLGEKVERRMLEGFDYKKPTPSRDTEFARPPRQQQRRRVHTADAPKQKKRNEGITEPRKFKSAKVQNTSKRRFARHSFTSASGTKRVRHPVI